MTGILANSQHATMLVGLGTDATVTGFRAGALVTLRTDAADVATWLLVAPAASSATLARLPMFRPDVAGDYLVIAALGDGTVHKLRVTVAEWSAGFSGVGVNLTGALQPQIQNPPTGKTLYIKSDGILYQRTPAGVDSAV